MKAILIKADDWEGLYINGGLFEEGHNIGEGDKERFWLDLARKSGITSEDLSVFWIDELDEEDLYECGCFPPKLSMLNGVYGD